MNKKSLGWIAFGALALLIGVIQFIPSDPIIAPVNLPSTQRDAHRIINFEGIANFRDLGGYATDDGRTVRWGSLYRSGNFAHTSQADLVAMSDLALVTLIDFRSSIEKEEEPNFLPDPSGFSVVEIPTLDDGNQAMVGEIMQRIEDSNFEGFDPNSFMLSANRQLATAFTPQFKQFITEVLSAKGAPIVWHCSAGKDRTGFAAAILLRILGVSDELVMRDYLMSKEPALAARSYELSLLRLFSGAEAAEKMAVMMGVEAAWLQAAFDEIDQQWGSFDLYITNALQLTPSDIEQLKSTLLE